MAETAGGVLVDTLIAWGVDTIFGMPRRRTDQSVP
jgi:thiamine pyrophosphate-dependent acetolactate synthase large subunit-like protein